MEPVNGTSAYVPINSTASTCVKEIVDDTYLKAIYIAIGMYVTAVLQYALLYFIYVHPGSFGLMLNTFVIVVLAHHKPMHRHLTNVFIANLSAIDAAVSIALILTTLFQNESKPRTPGYLPDEFLCRVWFSKLPLWSTIVSSAYGILALTFERYLGIVHPFWHATNFTKTKVVLLVGSTWFVGVAYNVAYQVPTSQITEQCQCTIFTKWPSLVTQRLVGVLTVVLQYFLPLALLLYLYIRMAITLRGKSYLTVSESTAALHDAKRSVASMNIVKTLATVAVIFFICWTPNQFSYLLYNLAVITNELNTPFHMYTVILLYLNSCINPIIYCIRYQQFQDGVRSLIKPLYRRLGKSQQPMANPCESTDDNSSYQATSDDGHIA